MARAAASPWNMGLAGAGVAAAAALGSWPLAVLSGAAYLALVAWDVASPDFWKRALGAPPGAGLPDREEVPDPRRLSEPALQEAARALLAAREALDRVVRSAQGDVAAELGGMTVSVDELTGRAARLLLLGDDIARYLSGSRRPRVEAELARLRDSAARTRDGAARADYEHTIAVRQEQLGVFDELSASLERVQASVGRIVATLEGLAAKVIQLGTLDAQAMENLSGDVSAELTRVNRDIATYEETLRQVAATAEVPR